MNLTELLDKNQEHRREISESKFLELLKERCRNSYAVIRRAPIYTADTAKSDFLVVTPANREVKSSFWVDRMVQKLNTWNRFPSRSRFLRGYTDAERAGNVEADLFVLIPFDNARIGICPKSSFYKSFTLITKDLGIERLDNDGLSRWINHLTRSIKKLHEKAKFDEDTTPDTFVEFTKLVKEIDEVISANRDILKRKLKDTESVNDEDRRVLLDLLGKHITNTQDYIDHKLDPENNDFRSVRIESLSTPNTPREVWTDSQCLMIKLSKYKELYKRGAVK